MIAIGDVLGPGKSTVAWSITQAISADPGDMPLCSDIKHKCMFGVGPLEHLPQQAYAPNATAR